MERMKLALLLLCSMSLGGCALSHFGSGTPGSGKLTTVKRSVGAFSKVLSEGPADVQITVGKTTSIEVTIDDNLEKHLKTTVKNDQLIISTDKSVNPTKLKVVITTPSLSEFGIDGAGDAKISGIEGATFVAQIDGAGTIDLTGRANSVKLGIDGAGDIHAFDLKSSKVSASINGAGTIELHADTDLDAEINGAGDIRYRGGASVKKSIEGAGSVSKG